MLKITSEELSNAIQNASEQDLYYASEDVKNFIKQNGGEQWLKMKNMVLQLNWLETVI